MHLTVINGSPRRKKSNTSIVLEHFLNGFESVPGNSYDLHYHHELDSDTAATKIINNTTHLLIAFPLYYFGVPAQLMRFFHRMRQMELSMKHLEIGFLCQYGFKEACHARALERQLKFMCEQMNFKFLGMIIKGDCENIQYMPPVANRKLFMTFEQLGETLGRCGEFNQQSLDVFSAPEYVETTWLTPYMMQFKLHYINHFHWKKLLKKHDALDRNFAQPLLDMLK